MSLIESSAVEIQMLRRGLRRGYRKKSVVDSTNKFNRFLWPDKNVTV